MYTFSFHRMKTIVSYSIATGFGSGYSRYMPGTIGTIWAWIMFLILDYLFVDIVLSIDKCLYIESLSIYFQSGESLSISNSK